MEKADFEEIINLIDEEIVTNGQGLIDAVLLRGILKGMLTAVSVNLESKVDAETGKGLSTNDFTTALKNKLNAMPNITNYDAANDCITIGSKTYQLTEYVPIPDHYVGWTTGNKASFNALTDQQIASLANVVTSDTYTRAFGTDSIFFLLYRSGTAPQSIIFTSQGTPMQQDIVSDNSFGSHADVTIGVLSYKIFGIYMSGNDPTDSITLNF